MQHGLMPVSWSVPRSTDSPTKLSSYCKVEQEGAALSLVITLLVITFILLQQTQNNAHNSIFDNIFFPSWVRTFLVTNFCMLALLLVVVVAMLLLLLLLYSFQGCFIDSSTICAVLEVYIANSCSKKQFYNFVVLYENFSIGNHFQIGCTRTEVTNVSSFAIYCNRIGGETKHFFLYGSFSSRPSHSGPRPALWGWCFGPSCSFGQSC